ncbi:MAG: hypothetical protein Q8O30_00005 [Candidatus Omnitrophota bacterium]|nr:hypothetical protein [Candidatus Omnitrophota bacterium]
MKKSKKFWVFCFFVSLIIIVKLVIFNWFTLSKGAINFRKPISYVNQQIDLSKKGLIQEYHFESKINSQYNIEAKIISNNFNPYKESFFDGEYRISIFDKNNLLIKELIASMDCTKDDFMQKKCFKISITGDIRGLYYALGENISLKENTFYTLRIETLKGLSIEKLKTDKNIKFQLVVSPLEYNQRHQKNILFLQLISLLLISGLCLIKMR